MRAGLNGAAFLECDGKFVGVNLGWDYTSEHEWGIKNLKRYFGIPEKSDKILGFKARKISTIPKDLVLVEKDTLTYLVFFNTYDWQKIEEKNYESMIVDHYDKNKELICSWDENSFGVRVIGEENRKKLRELYEAFKKKDVVIFLGASKPFSNGGLKICIYSRIPESAKNEAIDTDEDNIKLLKAAKDTGIEDRLSAVDADSKYWDRRCSFFALSPRWAFDKEKNKTKYNIMFFLNPMNQDSNNFGWFTVEELDQWIEGKGPIPK